MGRDVTWSALYAANWRFVQGGVDYFTPGDVPSPVQHFWSLAVEEQFYLVWPLVLPRPVAAVDPRRGVEATGGLLAVVAVLATASAGLSLALAGTDVGYFGTHVRAYQLLAGAALAIAARRWRSACRRDAALPWGGAVLATGGLAVAGVDGGVDRRRHGLPGLGRPGGDGGQPGAGGRRRPGPAHAGRAGPSAPPRRPPSGASPTACTSGTGR